MKIKITRDQYDTLVDALSSAYTTADRYVREAETLEVTRVLEKERDEFIEVLTDISEQVPEDWNEEK